MAISKIKTTRQCYESQDDIVNVEQQLTPSYKQQIEAMLPAGITLAASTETEDLFFDYLCDERQSYVNVSVAHNISATPASGDCDHSEELGYWHEYMFHAVQQYDEEVDPSEQGQQILQSLSACFVHPVETKHTLNRAKVVSRMATLAAGWALLDLPEHSLVYRDGSCIEYATAYDPDLRLSVIAQAADRVDLFGVYDAATMTKLLLNWNEPGMGSPAPDIVPKHNFHVNIRASLPGAGLDLPMYAADLATIALDSWYSTARNM